MQYAADTNINTIDYSNFKNTKSIAIVTLLWHLVIKSLDRLCQQPIVFVLAYPQIQCCHNLLYSLCSAPLSLPDQDRSQCLLVKPLHQYWSGCSWTNSNAVELLSQDQNSTLPVNKEQLMSTSNLLYPQYVCNCSIVIFNVSHFICAKPPEMAFANYYKLQDKSINPIQY